MKLSKISLNKNNNNNNFRARVAQLVKASAWKARRNTDAGLTFAQRIMHATAHGACTYTVIETSTEQVKFDGRF